MSRVCLAASLRELEHYRSKWWSHGQRQDISPCPCCSRGYPTDPHQDACVTPSRRLLADAGAGQFAVPVVLASVHQLPALSLGGDTTASITLIARRSAQRAGTRHWRRGADLQVGLEP